MQYDEITEGNDHWQVARITRPDNVIIALDALDSSDELNVYIYEVDATVATSPGTTVATITKDKAALTSEAIITTATSASALTNDGYWNGLDDEGYNFILRTQWGASGMEGGKRYRYELELSTINYGTICWTTGIYVRARAQ